jgi:transcriptional regulator with XRE-family HTH domain
MPVDSVALPGLKAARVRKLLTQEELADAAGLGRSTLARIETGAPAALRTVRRLAAALDIDPEVLLEPDAPTTRVAERRAPYRAGGRGGTGKGAEAA